MFNGHIGGGWWWMTLMMVVFWGGVIWLAVSFTRRSGQAPSHQTLTPPPAPAQILAERLARGEIDADDYRTRLEALQRT